ncbi:MAG: (Fe-S)-binding protein [Smithellaceae bacterium]
MFHPETCKRCGACLIACPSLSMTKDPARREILQLVDHGATGTVLSSCAGCAYCDSICPTKSNPSGLRKEILQAQNRKAGVSGLRIMSDEVPFSIMSAGLETDKDEKLERLSALTNPEPCEEVFYLGCSLSYIYNDLAQTSLLNFMPAIGGMKYCCGAYAHQLFGKREAQIKGRALLAELKKIGVKRLITFCPECDYMLGYVYPSIIEEFDIKTRSILDYLLEQHEKGRIAFKHPLPQKVTFHDSCAWRKLGPQTYETPRRLLRAMGMEVVEMKHNREKSTCCGTPLLGRNSPLAANIAEKRVMEAKATGANALVVGCSGCFALSGPAAKQGLDTCHITELIQMAIGEKPLHRIEEIKTKLVTTVITKMSAEPSLFARKYIIEDGIVKRL